jgi:hypothetical protein
MLEILIEFNKKLISVKNKKLKDRYHKLILFKVWVSFYKSDETTGVISEVLRKKKKY